MKPVTLATLREMKAKGEKIACLTAYDYSFAQLLDNVGMDLIMVGDSLGMVMQGHDSTLPVSMAEMVYHGRCVARGVKRALLVVDMPFMSYQQSPGQALMNAGRLMRKGGAQVVKLEGGAPMAPTVKFLTERGIPVCGHLGLTPQSVNQLGGYRVQGREEKTAEQIRKDAKLLEAAGAGLIVLEAMPAALAKTISQEPPFPPSASAPELIATARFWCCRTCSGFIRSRRSSRRTSWAAPGLLSRRLRTILRP